jgi:hypothetical protein
MLKIDNQKCVIFGLQGSGKTYFGKRVVRDNNYTVLVYSPHKHDFTMEGNNFIFYNASDFYGAFERFVELAIKLGKLKKIHGVLIDEFDMLFSTNFDIKKAFNDLTLNHRHYNLFILGMSRRPQDIPTKFCESSKYTVSFALQGDNVRKKFNNIYSGMGDMIVGISKFNPITQTSEIIMPGLSFENHEYIVKEIGKPPVKYTS